MCDEIRGTGVQISVDSERLLGCLRMLMLHDVVFDDVLGQWLLRISAGSEF